MKSFLAGVLVGILVPACSGTEQDATSGGATTDPSCTPVGRCMQCTSCFDACLCGGGTARRCAGSCGTATNPPDGGSVAPDAAPRRGSIIATLVTDAFDIPPGDEYFRCQNFSNPFGRDVAVLDTESFMTAGSHHMFVFQSPGATDGDLEVCGGLEFGPNLHLAQQSQAHTGYPEGVGRFLSRGDGLRVQIHYLNTSSEPVHAEIAVTIHADPPEEVPVHASQIFINTFGIGVAPYSAGTADSSCSVPHDVNVFSASSHMHRHGVYFRARASDGQLLFETDQWAEPRPWAFSPPRKLAAGSTIQVHCDYQNDTGSTLSFGESAATNEMCIFAGGYYPAADGEAITCLF